MPISTHELSSALFVRGLTNLKVLLHKGASHAESHGIDAYELLDARLASDMHSLASQVHWAAEGAKLTMVRLVGDALEPARETACTFDELQRRLDASIAFVESFAGRDLEAGLARQIVIEYPRGRMLFTGERFLREFAIPTFFFHVTSAYGILRNRGVDVTKGDFLGSFA